MSAHRRMPSEGRRAPCPPESAVLNRSAHDHSRRGRAPSMPGQRVEPAALRPPTSNEAPNMNRSGHRGYDPAVRTCLLTCSADRGGSDVMARRGLVLWIVAVSGALWFCAVILTAIYYLPGAGITYTSNLCWQRVAALLPRVGAREVRLALGVYDAAFWVTLAIAAGSVIARHRVGGRWPALAMTAPLILLFPLNLAGIVGVFVTVVLRQPLDGEFLGEGWPQNCVYALWTVSAALVAASIVRRPVPVEATVPESRGRRTRG